MWVRVLTKDQVGPWHQVLSGEDGAYLTACGEDTRQWTVDNVVEARYNAPLVEDTCGWCMAKMMELIA